MSECVSGLIEQPLNITSSQNQLCFSTLLCFWLCLRMHVNCKPHRWVSVLGVKRRDRERREVRPRRTPACWRATLISINIHVSLLPPTASNHFFSSKNRESKPGISKKVETEEDGECIFSWCGLLDTAQQLMGNV